jgi:hypothetical protein
MKKAIWLVLLFLFLETAGVHAQDQNPWNEVFTSTGSLNPNLIDLGSATEHPEWMSLQLPFNQSLPLEANYHRFQTPEGNIVVLPSASTLFFMAMKPQESGLAASYGSLGNGYGAVISFLGQTAGSHLDWNRVQAEHPEYKTPDQFWGAVLASQQEAWTYFSGWGFITNLLQMSWNDAAFRSMYLLYLNGSQNCGSIPGGCSGVVSGAKTNPPANASACPAPTVTLQQPVLAIRKIAPNQPLVVGQDPETRRGADVEAAVTIPPVIFTWFEAIYEDRDVCRPANEGEFPNCIRGEGILQNNGVTAQERVFKECRKHVENLPDAVATLKATAALDAASQDWITGKLGKTHYEAFVHQANFSLIPGQGTWTGGCDGGGTCVATGRALRVPFADPGTFNLQLEILTSGTYFQGIPITQPRKLEVDGTLQVYVTLPALIP